MLREGRETQGRCKIGREKKSDGFFFFFFFRIFFYVQCLKKKQKHDCRDAHSLNHQCHKGWTVRKPNPKYVLRLYFLRKRKCLICKHSGVDRILTKWTWISYITVVACLRIIYTELSVKYLCLDMVPLNAFYFVSDQGGQADVAFPPGDVE